MDGRGGGTGAAPDVFKNNISVPTMAALARARQHLDDRGRPDVTLIATQREDLRNRLVVDSATNGLQNFFEATVELTKVMARACGHDSLASFERRDLRNWEKDIAERTSVEYAGIGR